ncbi:unnamed protein product [Lasius platythorax]|uniref:Uncharacterized protein n=1 Tax=Lasius platythorax TaxID=488582 RepID=A0AAV2P093_9HYME
MRGFVSTTKIRDAAYVPITVSIFRNASESSESYPDEGRPDPKTGSGDSLCNNDRTPGSPSTSSRTAGTTKLRGNY